MSGRALVRVLWAAVLLACALSAAAVFAFGGYDLRLGPIHIGSHSAFKSLLQMEGAFLLAVGCMSVLSAYTPGPPNKNRPVPRPGLWIWALVTAAYASSLPIRFRYYDWEHGNVTGGLHSLRDFASLFTQPEWDRFYRPLTFVSLWADDRIFGAHGW